MNRPLVVAAVALAALLACPAAHADPQDPGDQKMGPDDAPSAPGGPQGGPGDQQDGGPGDPGGPPPGDQPPDNGGREKEGGEGGEAPAGPVTLSDAKANVGTLIQSFIAQHSVEGAWPLRDKRTKQVRRLTLVKVEEKGVKPAGGSRYSAPASLKDLNTGQTLEASFIVDFTGPEWKIVGMRLKPPAGKPPSAPAAKKGK